jgi:hypothetical protein
VTVNLPFETSKTVKSANHKPPNPKSRVAAPQLAASPEHALVKSVARLVTARDERDRTSSAVRLVALAVAGDRWIYIYLVQLQQL